jgi:hypothetical protein
MVSIGGGGESCGSELLLACRAFTVVGNTIHVLDVARLDQIRNLRAGRRTSAGSPRMRTFETIAPDAIRLSKELDEWRSSSAGGGQPAARQKSRVA